MPITNYGSYDAAHSPINEAAYRQAQQQQQGGGVFDWAFGSQGNPGVAGTGYRQPGQVSLDPNAAKIPGYEQDRSSALAQAMGAAGRAGPQMQGASINMRPQDQFRGQQMSLAQALTAQANGQGPSLAQMQLQQATDKNLAQSMALGQSLGGAQAAGLAQRQVMQQQAGTAQQAAADSGALRLQEQMQARNMLGQVLAGARGQDIGLASEQAGLQQGAASNNLQALLSQQGMNDAQNRFYSGSAYDMAGRQGAQNLSFAQLAAQTGLSNEQLQQQAYEEAARRRMGIFQSAAQMGGQVAGGAAGGIGSALATAAMV
jgi:hypothetical protein